MSGDHGGRRSPGVRAEQSARAGKGVCGAAMPRIRLKVAALAAEANRSLDDVLALLRDAGIAVSSPCDHVPKSKCSLARAALSLDRRMPDKLSVTNIVGRAGATETQVRQRFLEAGILKKARLAKVPYTQLRQAELLLGIRKATPVEPSTEAAATRETSKDLAVEPERVIIGKEQDIRHLSATDIETIHFALVRDFSGSKDPIDPPGVKSVALLESAAGRARTSLGKIDKYPTVPMAAAALTHAIVHNHPFHNGNKRTALVSLLVFLDKNGFLLETTQDTLYDLLLQIASHSLRYYEDDQDLQGPDLEVEYIARWLAYYRTRAIATRERRPQWRHLRKILQYYGCQLDVGQGNRINIVRGMRRTQVAFRNWGTDVEIEVMRKVRMDLELDEENGYDSDIFYNRDAKLPKFINDYRKLLGKLARV